MPVAIAFQGLLGKAQLRAMDWLGQQMRSVCGKMKWDMLHLALKHLKAWFCGQPAVCPEAVYVLGGVAVVAVAILSLKPQVSPHGYFSLNL